MAVITKIGVENLLDSATVTASTDATNAPNLWEGFLDDFWTPGSGAQTLTIDHGSAKAIDYWGIAGHNLGTDSASIAIAWSDDNISYTTIETLNPSDDSVICSTFTQVSHRYTKITVTGTAAKIARIHVGTTTTLDGTLSTPFTPPKLSGKQEFRTPITEGGLPVGRSVKHTAYEFTLSMRNVTPAWVESNWLALYAQLQAWPFFLLWDETNHPDDAAFVWLIDAANPSYASQLYMTHQLRCRGAV